MFNVGVVSRELEVQLRQLQAKKGSCQVSNRGGSYERVKPYFHKQ